MATKTNAALKAISSTPSAPATSADFQMKLSYDEYSDVVDSALSLTDPTAQSVASDVTLAGISTFNAGLLNTNVVTQSGTGAEDLTAVAADTVWIASTTQAGNITLPQATAANAGMKIKIIAGANWATSAFKLGFASGGSTVMIGTLNVMTLDANSAAVGFAITNNAKNLVIDADAVATAGGAKGSVYEFTYISANLVLAEVNAYITTGTVATTAAASVTGGI